MAIKVSKALRNHLCGYGSWKSALQNGIIKIFSGAQPTLADDAATGTLLCTFTDNSGAHTNEVISLGTIQLTGGASGSVNTVTVNSVNIIPNGAVPFNVSLNQTASDLCDAINQSQSSPEYRASVLAATVTIYAMPGSGAAPNGFVVGSTLTTITASHGNMASGVNAANGLKLAAPAAGIIQKLPSQTWAGLGVAGGTGGYFRYLAAVADAGGADTTESLIRMQGDLGTSGAALNLASTTFVGGAPNSVSSFSFTVPAAA